MVDYMQTVQYNVEPIYFYHHEGEYANVSNI